MRKIVTLKDKITQEDIYPIVPDKAVIDKNGSSILGVLDSEAREVFDKMMVSETKIDSSLNSISGLEGLSLSDDKIKDLADLVVQVERNKEKIELLNEVLVKIGDLLDTGISKSELGIYENPELIEKVDTEIIKKTYIKFGTPEYKPKGKELRIGNDSKLYIGLDGLWYVVESSGIAGKKNWIEEYLTFEAVEDSTFSFSKSGLSYSVDKGKTWKTLSSGSNTPKISSGNSIMFKGSLSGNTSSSYGKFSSTGKFKVAGNIMSLLFGDSFIGKTDLTGKSYAFYGLFYNCTGLVDALNLKLPATTLSTYCYSHMFRGCTGLTTEISRDLLPSVNLAEYCYYCMFTYSSLSATIDLPATILKVACYQQIFAHTQVEISPELPATVLVDHCYHSMFQNSTNLRVAPELPAKKLQEWCYGHMFENCKYINQIMMLATDISAGACLKNWVLGVSSSGTFIKNSAATWNISGEHGIPSGWTVEKINVPSTLNIEPEIIEEELDDSVVPIILTLDIDWINSIELWYKELKLDTIKNLTWGVNIYPQGLIDKIEAQYPGEGEFWSDLYLKIDTVYESDTVLIYINEEPVAYETNESGEYIGLFENLQLGDTIDFKTLNS